LELRYYQKDAIADTYSYLREHPDKNPVIVLPTGAGKTPVLTSISRDAIKWGRRVMIVSHRKELLQQQFNTSLNFDDLKGKVGIYSSGLDQRDTDHPIIIGGVQSVYKRADEFGSFDLLIIDEAHLIPDNEGSMYQQLIAVMRDINPAIKILGLTATPYRTDGGYIYGDGRMFDDISYEIDVPTLIDGGFLCPLQSKSGLEKSCIKVDGVSKRAGDWKLDELGERATGDGMVRSAIADIIERTQGRKKVLVFSVNLAHGEEIERELCRRGVRAVSVSGDNIFRDEIIADFKTNPQTRFLVNCNLLTIGFDYPEIDCVVLLRPTCSAGLYYQMVGRGLRIHPAKDDCLILDYGGNIRRHGPINRVRVSSSGNPGRRDVETYTKQCPMCHEVVPSGTTKCYGMLGDEVCGHVFRTEKQEVSHNTQAAEDDILGPPRIEDKKVNRIKYAVHEKVKDDGEVSRTMRVDYYYSIIEKVSEWICIEHTGWAAQKAERWWRDRTNGPYPADCEDAVERALAGELKEPKLIRIKYATKYPEIVGYGFEEEV